MAIAQYSVTLGAARAGNASTSDDIQTEWFNAGLLVNFGGAWEVDGPTINGTACTCQYDDTIGAAKIAAVKAPLDARAAP